MRATHVPLAILLAVAGCSSGSSASAPDLAPSNRCGPGPWVRLRVAAVSYTTRLPIAGATGKLDACPELTLVSDATGYFDAQVTAGLPFDTFVEAPGFIPTHGGQSAVSADLELGGVALFPTELMSLFPHLTTTTPDLVVITALPPGTQPSPNDPCTHKDGITLSVVGHPEAVITYYGGTGAQPMLDPSLTTTGSLGAAEVSGLSASAGPQIELTASKPGCNVSFVSYPHTGKYKLENGILTLAGAFLPPVPPP